ncbi:hypothetical protein ZHAS_00012272 [Anopheles sinensis]|uniref:Uncharacterized protein n=1 Tax=Anopheles sinensis TaxID=74873 RepID=A0A084W273_ANOSI|nr:hypothetical protein ZHAS_00012272 [Anopheles sinensis]
MKTMSMWLGPFGWASRGAGKSVDNACSGIVRRIQSIWPRVEAERVRCAGWTVCVACCDAPSPPGSASRPAPPNERQLDKLTARKHV